MKPCVSLTNTNILIVTLRHLHSLYTYTKLRVIFINDDEQRGTKNNPEVAPNAAEIKGGRRREKKIKYNFPYCYVVLIILWIKIVPVILLFFYPKKALTFRVIFFLPFPPLFRFSPQTRGMRKQNNFIMRFSFFVYLFFSPPCPISLITKIFFFLFVRVFFSPFDEGLRFGTYLVYNYSFAISLTIFVSFLPTFFFFARYLLILVFILHNNLHDDNRVDNYSTSIVLRKRVLK